MKIIYGDNVVYIQPSDWARDVWVNNCFCNNRIKSLPFGVDTNKFNKIKPINERNEVFVYFKNRSPSDLEYIKNFLYSKNINYKIFSYHNRYNENEYLNCLQNAKYGIWVGGHESQGFGLQEALSCDVPLLVWSVKSMNQEYGSTYEDIPATTVSYWDERCGEVFYNISDLENTYNKFINNIEHFEPREFILENLSMEVCEIKLIETVNLI